MAFLKPDKTRTEYGLVIKEKIIPFGTKWKKNWSAYKIGDLYKADKKLSNGTGKVSYITIHNTEDIKEAVGTNDAEQYSRATWNQNMGEARVHYFVDETDCWQLLREDEVGWHAGDGGKGIGNNTSIAIEIIMNGKGNAEDINAEKRGALLAAILLKRHGLTIDKLVPHKKWSGKNCPCYILPHWSDFVKKVKEYLNEINKISTNTTTSTNASKDIFKVGDEVKLVSGAKYTSGKLCPNWLYDKKLYVRNIVEDNIVFSTLKTGDITGIANKKYLKKYSSVLMVGDKVKLKSDAYVYGTKSKFASFVYNSTLYVRSINGSRVVISTQKTGNITGAVEKNDLIKI